MSAQLMPTTVLFSGRQSSRGRTYRRNEAPDFPLRSLGMAPHLQSRSASVSMCRRLHLQKKTSSSKGSTTVVYAKSDGNDAEEDDGFVQNTEFGYSRKDVILITFALFLLGYLVKGALQFGGIEDLKAGTYAIVIMTLLLTFGWVGSYVWRVSNKDMTYVKQLKDYEEAVMMKRLQEMPPEEYERLMESKKVQEAEERLGMNDKTG